MARIDSLLAIAVDQGANELRIGANREPKMFASGAPKRLLMPAMGGDTVKELMGEILSPERETALRARGRLDVQSMSDKLGVFQVTLTAREAGIDAIFLRIGKGIANPPPAPLPHPVPSPSPLSSHGPPASLALPPPIADAGVASKRMVAPSPALL